MGRKLVYSSFREHEVKKQADGKSLASRMAKASARLNIMDQHVDSVALKMQLPVLNMNKNTTGGRYNRKSKLLDYEGKRIKSLVNETNKNGR